MRIAPKDEIEAMIAAGPASLVINNRDNAAPSRTNIVLGGYSYTNEKKEKTMLKCSVATLALTAALAAAPAWGQTKSPEPGMKADGGQFVTKQSASQWRASKLVGVNVYGPNDEKVGDISEVLVDRSGNAHSVVVGVGGFLGIGTKDVALPFSALKWVSHEEAAKSDRSKATTGSAPDSKNTDAYQGYPHHAIISMTKDQLKNAPEFRYASQGERTAPAPAPTTPRR